MNYYELSAFILYFIAMIAIGIYFFIKSKDTSEKSYFLGGRNMNGFVAAISAGASDMSAWCLMGLPGAIYLFGIGQVWISIGLFIGTVCAWLFVAPRLRRYVIKANDSITIPQFLTNRFMEKGKMLKIVSAIIFVIAYCIYAASSVSACADLFQSVFNVGDDSRIIVMAIVTIIIIAYTLLGGFNAVCWTDLIQGLLMLAALMTVPIIVLILLQSGQTSATFMAWAETPNGFWSFLSEGAGSWNSYANIITGLGWGLGYFGMPHIIVRYMSIKSEKEMRVSQVSGIIWTGLILLMATAVALVAHEYLGSSVADNKSMVFINMVKDVFKVGPLAIIGGVLLSAIVAASMSSADSQLLASSSAFVSDFYKSAIKENPSSKEIKWLSRIAVIFIAIIAFVIATLGLDDIMALVSAAWSIFGSAFGPAILLALYWKRLNYKGCVWGIVVGFVVSILWLVCFNLEYYIGESLIFNTGVYEIVPGFISGLVTAIVVSLSTKAPKKEVTDLFTQVASFKYDGKTEFEEVA